MNPMSLYLILAPSGTVNTEIDNQFLKVILFSAKYHDVIIIYRTCIEYFYDLFIYYIHC
jgi:hypothetical protein